MVRSFYSTQWQLLDVTKKYAMEEGARSRKAPLLLPEALRVASELSKPFSLVRVDLGTLGNRIVVQRLSFVPDGVQGPRFKPPAFGYAVAKLVQMPPSDAAAKAAMLPFIKK